jgi:hypothetical protein
MTSLAALPGLSARITGGIVQPRDAAYDEARRVDGRETFHG